MKKIENVKRPIKVGEVFLVPCVYREKLIAESSKYIKKIDITPVINHPHNDKENGQQETHYHADYRFIRTKKINGKDTELPDDSHPHHNWGHEVRANKDLFRENDQGIVYFALPVVNENQKLITKLSSIKYSKLKHKCIYKGKCPHRGYDLSQETPVNGVITCPLHGLKFDAKTKKITNTPQG